MSRSNPTEGARAINPAKKFYEWSGSEGVMTYYDKENKKKVEVPLPFTFLPLRRCVTVKGYNGDTETSYYSNEVKDTRTDVLMVYSVSGSGESRRSRLEEVGLYADIKDRLKAKGIKYVESLYVATYDDKKNLELCNIQIKGAALRPWGDVVKANNIWQVAISIKSFTENKKGGIKFKSPAFSVITKVKPETNEAAIKLDKEIEEYLNEYFKKNEQDAVNAKAETAAKPEAKSEPKAAAKPQGRSAATEEEDEIINDIINSNFDDDEAPF